MEGGGTKRKQTSEEQYYDSFEQQPAKRINYNPHKFLLKINKLQLIISTQTETQKYSIHRLLQDIKGHTDNRSINVKYDALFKIKWHLFNFTSNPSKDREKVCLQKLSSYVHLGCDFKRKIRLCYVSICEFYSSKPFVQYSSGLRNFLFTYCWGD